MGSLGKVVTGTTPKTSVAEWYIPSEVDFIAPADLGHTRQINSSDKKISSAVWRLIRGAAEGCRYLCLYRLEDRQDCG